MNLPYTIALHGALIDPDLLSRFPDLRDEIHATLTHALTQGQQCLERGGSATFAVIEVVKVLEDCPYFNAAKGSCLTGAEMVEMDAAIMSGSNHQFGALAGVRHIRNPIQLAFEIMQSSPNAYLHGEGAEAFAFERGFDFTEQDALFTELSYEQFETHQTQTQAGPSETKPLPLLGVGAVVLDASGHFAVASSSGGILNQRNGRIGDAAIIGASIYAQDELVAISALGQGDDLLRYQVAFDIAARMRYLHQSVALACEQVLRGELKEFEIPAAILAMDPQGQIHYSIHGHGVCQASLDKNNQTLIKFH